MELMILFFLMIFSNEYQPQLFGLRIKIHKNPGNDAEIELTIRYMETGIISIIKDFGIPSIKTYNNRTIGNILLCPLVSGKVYIP